jgi:hypothetical protein
MRFTSDLLWNVGDMSTDIVASQVQDDNYQNYDDKEDHEHFDPARHARR